MNNTILLDRPIAYHRIFAEIASSVVGGVFLSQAVYWANRTEDKDGWFWKTQEQWYEETYLSRSEQERARKALKDLGILEEKKQGIPAKLFFRVNEENLTKALESTVCDSKRRATPKKRAEGQNTGNTKDTPKTRKLSKTNGREIQQPKTKDQHARMLDRADKDVDKDMDTQGCWIVQTVELDRADSEAESCIVYSTETTSETTQETTQEGLNKSLSLAVYSTQRKNQERERENSNFQNSDPEDGDSGYPIEKQPAPRKTLDTPVPRPKSLESPQPTGEGQGSAPPAELKIEKWADFRAPGRSPEFWGAVLGQCKKLPNPPACIEAVAESWIQKQGGALWTRFSEARAATCTIISPSNHLEEAARRDRERLEALKNNIELQKTAMTPSDLSGVRVTIDTYIARLGWSLSDAAQFMVKRYNWQPYGAIKGVIEGEVQNLGLLTDDDVIDMAEALEELIKEVMS